VSKPSVHQTRLLRAERSTSARTARERWRASRSTDSGGVLGVVPEPYEGQAHLLVVAPGVRPGVCPLIWVSVDADELFERPTEIFQWALSQAARALS